MTQNIITAGNATSLFSQAAGDDGTFKIVVGPNGSQVDALAFSATGVPTFAAGGLKLATAIATTSGTSHDFTGIPSWVKRITVMFNGVSTNGASEITLRGGAGTIEATGYAGATASTPNATASTVTAWSTGATVISSTGAASLYYGTITLTLIGSNTWSITGALGRADALQITMGGAKTFSGTLDRVRLTTVNGTDAFDAGSVNILYEG